MGSIFSHNTCSSGAYINDLTLTYDDAGIKKFAFACTDGSKGSISAPKSGYTLSTLSTGVTPDGFNTISTSGAGIGEAPMQTNVCPGNQVMNGFKSHALINSPEKDGTLVPVISKVVVNCIEPLKSMMAPSVMAPSSFTPSAVGTPSGVMPPAKPMTLGQEILFIFFMLLLIAICICGMMLRLGLDIGILAWLFTPSYSLTPSYSSVNITV